MPGDLQTFGEQLSQSFQDWMPFDQSEFQNVNQKLNAAASDVSNTTQAQREVATQLQETLQDIENVRTQDLSARLIAESGVVEGIQAPEADIQQLEAVTDQIDTYVQNVAEINNRFMEGQISKNQAQNEFNALLGESTDKLQNQTEQIGIQQEQADQLVQKFETINSLSGDYLDEMEGSQAVEEERGAFNRFADQAQRKMEAMSVGGAGLEVALTEALKKPWILGGAVLLGGLTKITQEFLELDEAAQSFLEETGFGTERASRLRSNLADLGPQLAMAGLEAADLVEATSALAEQWGNLDNAAQAFGSTFGGIENQTEALRQEIIAVAGRLNMGGAEAAEMLTQFQEIASATGISRQNLQVSAIEAANITDTAPAQVMEDIADSSEQLAKFSGTSGEKLAAAAAQARNLGTNIGEVAELNEQILSDIPGFVQGLEKARTLAPQIGLNPQQLTQAAAQGPEALTSELEQQFQDVDMGNLDFFTKQRLSEAFGMSVQQLSRISQRAKMADQNIAGITERIQEGDATMSEAFQATGATTQLTRLQRQLSAIGAQLMNALVPVLEDMADVLMIVANGLQTVFNWMDSLAEKAQPLYQNLKKLGVPMETIKTAILGPAGIVAGTKAVVGAFNFLATTIPGMTATTFTFTGALSSLGTMLSSILPSALTTFAASLSATGVGAIIVGIGAAATGAYFAFQNWGQTVSILKSALDSFVETVFGVSDGMGAINSVINTASMLWDQLWSVVSQMSWTEIALALGPVGIAIGGTVVAIQKAVTWIGQFVDWLDIASVKAQTWGDILGTVVAAPFYLMLTPIRLMIDLVQTMISAVEAIPAVWNSITSSIQAGVNKVKSFIGSIADTIASIPNMIMGAGGEILDALIPDMASVQQGMQSLTSTIASYIPFSPAEQGPLANLGKANISGEIAKTITPEPVQQEMESTMGQATQAASDTVQAAQSEQANQVQVEGGGDTVTAESADLPDGIIPLLKKIANNEQQILAALQQMDTDAYLDSKKVTDKLRKENNKNTMKTV